MAKSAIQTQKIDSKGRVMLGKAFVNKTVLVEQRGDEIVIRLARVTPKREEWLHQNPSALEGVRRGIEQAQAGELIDGPDLA